MFILGSSSVSRLEVLKKIGFVPEKVVSSEIDETPKKGETPLMLSLRLAKEKGLKLAEAYPESAILSADTVVAVGRRVIDKCLSENEVRNAMKMLSGRNHRVFTTICITKSGRQSTRTVETRIKFKRLTNEELEVFIKTGEGIGKAGGYSILGFAESFILQINGSVSGVIGLPSYETTNLLLANGVKRNF